MTMTMVHPCTPPGAVPTEPRLPIPPLPPGNFCGASVLGTRWNNAFGDVINLDGTLEGLNQSLNKGKRMRPTLHVSISNSKTNCLLVRPSSYSCWVGFSTLTSSSYTACKVKVHRKLTDHRFSRLEFQTTAPISDEEGKIEKVLHGLCKIIRVDNKPEQVDRPAVFKDMVDLIGGRGRVSWAEEP